MSTHEASSPFTDDHAPIERLLAELKRDPASLPRRSDEVSEALYFLLNEVRRLRYTIADLLEQRAA